MPFAHRSSPLPRILVLLALMLSAALALGACGSSSHSSSSASHSTGRSTATPSAPPLSPAELAAAEHPRLSDFPAARGVTLQQLAAKVGGSAQLGAATGTFTPGSQRFAFALNSSQGSFIYAPTVIYIAKTPGSPAQGPFPAPADPLTVPPPFRSAQNQGPGGIQAIYAAQLPLPRPGTYTLLTLSRTPHGLIGAPGEVAVAAHSPIPAVGQQAPAAVTDTLATVHGDRALLTTRSPAEPGMQQVSLRDVLGHRPVVLLFSTPQLCVSRVCGPVTDIAVYLRQHFGTQAAFIHQEVYVDNQPSKGLRPAMQAFSLRTEPWLFTIDRHGRIAARLEGSFGVNAFTQAIRAALR